MNLARWFVSSASGHEKGQNNENNLSKLVIIRALLCSIIRLQILERTSEFASSICMGTNSRFGPIGLRTGDE